MKSNILKIGRYIKSIVALLAVCALAQPQAKAINITQNQLDDDEEIMLIINSYGEGAMWTYPYTTPILLYTAAHDGIHCEQVYMNNVLITDSLVYNTTKKNIFETYKDHHPSYVVCIGNMAFTLRDEIKKEWGDLPILLITRDVERFKLEDYFSGIERTTTPEPIGTMADQRDEYNFTAIVMPYNYKETIELMVKMLPDLNEVIFASDNIYVNRIIAQKIKDFLLEEYPGIKYSWLPGSAENAITLRQCFANPMPQTGILMSTWGYESSSTQGTPSFVSSDINLFTGAKNPVFSLRESYIQKGALGGVYYSSEEIESQITKVLDLMMAGKSMRDVPFYSTTEDMLTVINYRILEKFNLTDFDFPKNTKFFNKPKTFFEKYLWEFIILGVIFLLLVLAVIRRMYSQRERIALLRRHEEFMQHMPIPYAKGAIIYKDNEIEDIKYTLKNQAFTEILITNSKKGEFRLFTKEFVADKVRQLVRKHRDVNFTWHFDNSNTYYDFRFCLVNTKPEKIENSNKITEIDVFAIDITGRYKAEMKYKEAAKKLDIAINLAGVIPWDWDLINDVMTFDTYSLFQRLGHNFVEEDSGSGVTTLNTMSEFFPLVEPEDLNKLREIRAAIFDKEITEFSGLRYRIHVNKDHEDQVVWVEVSGTVTKTDQDGNPLFMAGSMMVINENTSPTFKYINS